MSNNNSQNNNRNQSIANLIRNEEENEIFSANASTKQMLYLLEKNTEALKDQIKRKDDRMDRQDKQIDQLCTRIKEILDKDVESSLMEDFEGGTIFSENLKTLEEAEEEQYDFSQGQENEGYIKDQTKSDAQEEAEGGNREEAKKYKREFEESKEDEDENLDEQEDYQNSKKEKEMEDDELIEDEYYEEEEKEKGEGGKTLWDKFKNIIKSE